jgi:hypothetical protein
MKIALPFVIVGLDPTIHNDKGLFTIERVLNTIHKPYGFWIPAFAGMTVLDWIVYFHENLHLK